MDISLNKVYYLKKYVHYYYHVYFRSSKYFFIYQMLSKSYKDCINKFISDTFHLQEEKQLEIKKPEDNEIEDVYIVIKNDALKLLTNTIILKNI